MVSVACECNTGKRSAIPLQGRGRAGGAGGRGGGPVNGCVAAVVWCGRKAMPGAGIGAMVGLLWWLLLVVPVSFGVAARADAKARRMSESRASDQDRRGSVAAGRCDRWRKLATRAWLICGGASLVTGGVVGVLIFVG